MINYDVKPNNCNIGLIKPIVKDSNKSWNDISNLRPITISDPIASILERILLNEIDKYYPNIEQQFGFKSSSSCNHAYLVLKEILAINRRSNKLTYICAIDASKAFDKVSRELLWNRIIDKTPKYISRCLINYYSVSKAHVMVKDKLSDIFRTSIGVKQGGPLSPRLFCAYMEELNERLNSLNIGFKISNIYINNLMYADDVLLIANSKEELERLLEVTTEFGKDFEIKFNPDKTTFMIANEPLRNEIKEELTCNKAISAMNSDNSC
jgi:hypothetical protein